MEKLDSDLIALSADQADVAQEALREHFYQDQSFYREGSDEDYLSRIFRVLGVCIHRTDVQLEPHELATLIESLNWLNANSERLKQEAEDAAENDVKRRTLFATEEHIQLRRTEVAQRFETKMAMREALLKELCPKTTPE